MVWGGIEGVWGGIEGGWVGLGWVGFGWVSCMLFGMGCGLVLGKGEVATWGWAAAASFIVYMRMLFFFGGWSMTGYI